MSSIGNNSSQSTAFNTYKCCNRPFMHYVCVKCFSVIHKCCLSKYKNKIKHLRENKIVCCQSTEESFSNDDDEKSILEKTINDLTDDSEMKTKHIKKLREEKKNYLCKRLSRRKKN